MKTILSSFHCELLQKLKQLNIMFLITSIVKREALSVSVTIIGKQKYKIEEKSNT